MYFNKILEIKCCKDNQSNKKIKRAQSYPRQSKKEYIAQNTKIIQTTHTFI